MTVPPHDFDAERHLLGACYFRPAGITEALAVGLTAGDFYWPDYAACWRELVVANLIGPVGLDDDGLWLEPPQVSRPDLYARRIIELASRRRLLEAQRDVELAIQGGFEPDLGRLRDALERVAA